MQRIAKLASGREPALANIWTGEQITLSAAPSTPLPFESGDSSSRSIAGGDTGQHIDTELNVIGPVGSPVQVELKPRRDTFSTTGSLNDWSTVFSNTSSPGLFRVEQASRQPELEIAPSLFAVHCPLSESDLRTLGEAEMELLADRLGASLVSSADELARSIGSEAMARNCGGGCSSC